MLLLWTSLKVALFIWQRVPLRIEYYKQFKTYLRRVRHFIINDSFCLFLIANGSHAIIDLLLKSPQIDINAKLFLFLRFFFSFFYSLFFNVVLNDWNEGTAKEWQHFISHRSLVFLILLWLFFQWVPISTNTITFILLLFISLQPTVLFFHSLIFTLPHSDALFYAHVIVCRLCRGGGSVIERESRSQCFWSTWNDSFTFG
jgi:hypothetical protein